MASGEFSQAIVTNLNANKSDQFGHFPFKRKIFIAHQRIKLPVECFFFLRKSCNALALSSVDLLLN